MAPVRILSSSNGVISSTTVMHACGNFLAKEASTDGRKVRTNRGNHSDTHRPGDRRFSLDYVAARRFEVKQNSPGAWKKRASKLRETNGAAEAIEEPRPSSSSSLPICCERDGCET